MGKTCDNCVYFDVGLTEEPCVDCDGPNCRFKPKEEDKGEKTYTMTFTAAKINDDALKTITGETEPDYKGELEQAKEENECLKNILDSRELELARQTGLIDGLKFALRCNGVSGGEVR